MKSRRGRSPRCTRCALIETLCICAEVRRIETRTEVQVVLHPNEARRTTSTGRLVPLVLSRGRIALARAAVPGRRLVALYPGDDALPIAAFAGEAALQIVVPDGTWPETRRMMRSDALLATLPRACLAPRPPRAPRLRAHPDASRLATLEAIAHALGILEGAEVRAALEHAYELFVARALEMRAGRV